MDGVAIMPEFSRRSWDRLRTCDDRLQRLFAEVVKHFDCSILCGHRTKEDQETAYSLGASKVVWPNSKHNSLPSVAVDVAPYPIDWKDIRRFYFFGGFVLGIASQMGIAIRWGGDWNRNTLVNDQTLNDLPHFEIFK
jgi:peptidoglycan L-alanyl-D-glutamate endopeptidase CwlK